MTTAVADPFSAPAPKGSGKYLPMEVRDENGDVIKGDTNCLMGRLILVTPTLLETGLPDKFDKTGVKKVDRITADVVVFDGPPVEGEEDFPLTYDGQYISGKVLISQMSPATKANMRGADPKRMILGRVEKLPPREKGHKPAYALADPTEDDKATARNYLATKDPFA